MKNLLLIAAALIVIAVGITGIALWGSRRTTTAEEQLRVVEERALAAGQIATALRTDKLPLERALTRTAAASKPFEAQLESVKRAAPTAKVESVVLHRSDAFEVPMAVDCNSSAHSPRVDSTPGAATPPRVAAPLLSVSTSEARLKTDAGTVAVVGETTVECVGGGCLMGWKHVDRWSADATKLFIRDEPKPLLRGWGIGLTAICVREGCGVGPGGLLPHRRWVTRRGMEVTLDGTFGVTAAVPLGGATSIGIRF